mmetsp:Transcript_17049/g.51788  ORF Transcript_17049/g.51788 Transcript_17049/m.51788 type:complete len:293 (-) Transcript_17049:329-1207(-)
MVRTRTKERTNQNQTRSPPTHDGRTDDTDEGRKKERKKERRLVVEGEDFVDVALAAHDDGAAVVDVFGHDFHDAAELALEHAGVGDAAGLLDDQGQRKAFVEDAQLALGGLFIRRIIEDAAVEDRAVYVRDHGPDVAGRVGLGPGLEHFGRLLDGLVPQRVVALVARVDGLALLGELHGAEVHEFPDAVVEREAVDGASKRDDEVRGAAVHHVPRGDHVRAGPQNVGDRRRAFLRRALEHGEDRARGDVAVYVGRAVQRIEGHAVLAALVFLNHDHVLFLFAHEQSAHARIY